MNIVYLIYIYITYFAATTMIFLGIFVNDDITSLISILTRCRMTWFGAIIGMIGVYS